MQCLFSLVKNNEMLFNQPLLTKEDTEGVRSEFLEDDGVGGSVPLEGLVGRDVADGGRCLTGLLQLSCRLLQRLTQHQRLRLRQEVSLQDL